MRNRCVYAPPPRLPARAGHLRPCQSGETSPYHPPPCPPYHLLHHPLRRGIEALVHWCIGWCGIYISQYMRRARFKSCGMYGAQGGYDAGFTGRRTRIWQDRQEAGFRDYNIHGSHGLSRAGSIGCGCSGCGLSRSVGVPFALRRGGWCGLLLPADCLMPPQRLAAASATVGRITFTARRETGERGGTRG